MSIIQKIAATLLILATLPVLIIIVVIAFPAFIGMILGRILSGDEATLFGITLGILYTITLWVVQYGVPILTWMYNLIT